MPNRTSYAFIDNISGQVVFNVSYDRLNLLLHHNPSLRYCVQDDTSEVLTLNQLSKDYQTKFVYSTKDKQPGWYEIVGKS